MSKNKKIKKVLDKRFGLWYTKKAVAKNDKRLKKKFFKKFKKTLDKLQKLWYND